MVAAWTTNAQTARRMSLQSRRDTRPELVLRSALHAARRRFRVAYPVPDMRRCSIDIAFPRQRVAVFVDGCFWHTCADHGSSPKANAGRWASKLETNRERDRRVNRHLEERGWVVVRIWEHEAAEAACSKVLSLLADVPATLS